MNWHLRTFPVSDKLTSRFLRRSDHAASRGRPPFEFPSSALSASSASSALIPGPAQFKAHAQFKKEQAALWEILIRLESIF
jgi:hypothetical protein